MSTPEADLLLPGPELNQIVWNQVYPNLPFEASAGFPVSTDDGTAWNLLSSFTDPEGRSQIDVTFRPTQWWPDEMEREDPEKLWRVAVGMSGTDMCWTEGIAPTFALAVCRCIVKSRLTHSECERGGDA